MEKYLPILLHCPLFQGIDPADLTALLGCLGARVLKKGKGEFIFREGDPAQQVGVILSGCAQLVRNDFYGNRSIVASIRPAQLFGESFACAGIDRMPVSVVAAEQSEIMLIDCRRITHTCTSACEFHHRMVLNLLKVVAAKNILFNQKIDIISKKTTREKLMAYLLEQASLNGSNDFSIPFDRQSLADYLGVERSALSAEIGKLRGEGILDSIKSRFILHEKFPG